MQKNSWKFEVTYKNKTTVNLVFDSFFDVFISRYRVK